VSKDCKLLLFDDVDIKGIIALSSKKRKVKHIQKDQLPRDLLRPDVQMHLLMKGGVGKRITSDNLEKLVKALKQRKYQISIWSLLRKMVHLRVQQTPSYQIANLTLLTWTVAIYAFCGLNYLFSPATAGPSILCLYLLLMLTPFCFRTANFSARSNQFNQHDRAALLAAHGRIKGFVGFFMDKAYAKKQDAQKHCTNTKLCDLQAEVEEAQNQILDTIWHTQYVMGSAPGSVVIGGAGVNMLQIRFIAISLVGTFAVLVQRLSVTVQDNDLECPVYSTLWQTGQWW
jgi:hypothetical protein